jgi:hypothetical protein
MSSALTQTHWNKLLLRWGEAPNIGEKRFLAHMLALALMEEARHKEPCWDAGFFEPGGAFDYHCEAIGADGTFVREQAARVYPQTHAARRPVPAEITAMAEEIVRTTRNWSVPA